MATQSKNPKPDDEKRGAKGSKGSKGPKISKHVGIGRKILRKLLVVLTVLVGLCLFASAYAGILNPASTKGYSGIVQMTFPIWLCAMGVMAMLNLLLYKRALWYVLLFCLATAGPILDFSPLHIGGIFHKRLTEEEQTRSFTLLTYNVQNFWVEPSARLQNGENATVNFILDTDADIVCLQEGRYYSEPSDSTPITSAQRRRLHRQYPYVYKSSTTQAILSKYPVQPLRLDFPNEGNDQGLISAYRINVEGLPVTLFNLHLHSIGLNDSDKRLYRGITSRNSNVADSITQIRTQLLAKLSHAFLARGEQADRLARYVNHLGGPNVIVCGDFNDVPGCYAVRRLSDLGLHQVYPEVGFGPMITFYQDKFYFRIDHVLYRGAMKPVEMTRPHIHASDHYPLLTTFLLTE